VTNIAAGEEAVFLDAMRTLSYVEKRYPDLAPGVARGRRVVTAWEAHRRLTGTSDIRWVNAGLRTSLRHDPLRLRLWRALVAANARYLMRTLRCRLKR
jgi:hypothetical protein